MGVFLINDKEANSLGEAIDLCREIWAEAKKADVEAQLVAVLNKKDNPAAARAAQGVELDDAETEGED